MKITKKSSVVRDILFLWLSRNLNAANLLSSFITEPVVLKIAASKMNRVGYRFGVTENEVWCTEEVPVKYICDRVYIK